MEVTKKEVTARGIKLTYHEGGEEIARVRLYILPNDLHEAPFCFIEDVFVNKQYRGRGFGTQIVSEALKEAKARGCYKVICTSRFVKTRVHEMYERIGFSRQGIEFRLDLNS